MTPVRFLSPALDEMCDAAEYYESQAVGLGSDLVDEIAHTVSRIREFPYAGVHLRQGVRRQMVKRFPFGLLYVVEEDEIIVLAVMHLRRRPSYWASRIALLKKRD